MKAPDFWSLPAPNLAANLLRPFGALYGGLSAWRMRQSGARVSAPVICVGNLVMGGAGKTPTAIALAKLLVAMRERPAFLSRGYGGARHRQPVAVDGAQHGADYVGDEPLLLARVAPTFVGADRLASAKAAIAGGASALIMDDGLQNPTLAKDLTLGVIDAQAGFGNGLCFPAGPLRAPVDAQIAFVSALLMIGQGPAPLGAAPVLRAQLRPSDEDAQRFAGRRVVAFAGIGRPEKFFATLEAVGAQIVARHAFPDHWRYSPSDIMTLRGEARAAKALLATTQKDYVRLDAEFAAEVVCLPVELIFDAPQQAIALLEITLAKRRQKL